MPRRVLSFVRRMMSSSERSLIWDFNGDRNAIDIRLTSARTSPRDAQVGHPQREVRFSTYPNLRLCNGGDFTFARSCRHFLSALGRNGQGGVSPPRRTTSPRTRARKRPGRFLLAPCLHRLTIILRIARSIVCQVYIFSGKIPKGV